MRLGVITDEVSQDFAVALDFAKAYGLDCVELRSAYEKGPFDYTEADILAIKALSDRYGIPVTAISSPMFKCEYSEENIRLHTEEFKKLLENVIETCEKNDRQKDEKKRLVQNERAFRRTWRANLGVF